jgi:hypothetical protein
VWERFERGRALYTMQPSAAEISALRARLRDIVAAQGLSALAGDGLVARDFLCFAASFIAESADRLSWYPVLRELGVPPDDARRYPELYRGLESALAALGRNVIYTRRGRRFLGTLLREGGLPTNIGNLPELIGHATDLFGWSPLRNPENRTKVIEHVRERASGAARTLLDIEEGRAALDDLLSTAAEARSLLIERGVDPTTLASPDEVRRALASAQIPLPALRNDALLAAVLTSFTREAAPVSPLASVRLVACERGNVLELLVHLDLDILETADVPSEATHVVLSAEPCPSRRTWLVERQPDGRFAGTSTGGRSTQWIRTGDPVPSSVRAKYAGPGGVPELRTIATLEWEHMSELWFDGDGELLTEARETLQPGERFLLLSYYEIDLSGSGAVAARRLSGPSPAACAWQIVVDGPGELRLSSRNGTEVIPSASEPLAVAVLPSATIEGVPKRFVLGLPDLALPDDVVATVTVQRLAWSGPPVVLREVSGFVRLSSYPALARWTGAVRVSVRADGGRVWRARWTLLPRFAVRPRIGVVDVVGLDEPIELVTNGTVLRGETPGVQEIRADAEEVRVIVHVRLRHGELISIPLEIPPRRLRLWSDRALTTALSVTVEPTVTERMIHAGACIEHAGEADSVLVVKTVAGDSVLRQAKRGLQRAFVGLVDLFAHQARTSEPTAHYVAEIEGSVEDAIAFRVHVPRLAQPRLEDAPEGRLRLRYELDPADLPDRAGLAYFPIVPPFGKAELFDATLEWDGERFGVVIDAAIAPARSGMYIVFLVDRACEPVRPMSWGRKLSVPLSRVDPPAPGGLSPLERAVWIRKPNDLARAIRKLVQTEAFDPFARALASATFERAPYGLRGFLFLGDIAEIAPWLVLACAARLEPAQQGPWFHMWSGEMLGFSWLRLTRGDVELLARALPPSASEDRMALLVKANGAQRMLRSTEHLLAEGLFEGPSLRCLDALKQQELNVARGVDILTEPHWFQLPRSGPGRSWLRGANLDADIQSAVDFELDRQIMKGLRARAIRDMYLRREQSPSAAKVEGPSLEARTTFALVQWIDAEWEGTPLTPLSYAIRKVDLDCAMAASIVVDHREGRAMRREAFALLSRLERLAPDLLDAWIAALSLRGTPGGSRA